MKILLKNCKIADSVQYYKNIMDVLIDNGRVIKIDSFIDNDADRVIDVRGLTVVPGFIDLHCHLREPGFEHKETIKSGTRAAARGGYTTVCCMPNTNPVIDNAEALFELRNIIKKDSSIEVIPIGAITKSQKGKELVELDELINKGVKLFSDDGHPVWDNSIMFKCLEFSKGKDILIIDHCEDIGLVEGGVINLGEAAKRLGLKSISGLSEELPIMRDIMLAEETNAKIHIAHISTAKSLNIIKEAKAKGINVSCEVTPHHIALSENDIIDGDTNFKVNPPLRSKKDAEALQNGLKDGIIDIIATDHAPHSEIDKPEDFYKAANGISGIEIAFSICYTYLVRTGKLSLNELIKRMSLNPSLLINLGKGNISLGSVADLTVIDLDRNFIVDKSKFTSKGKNTPFHGKELWGEILMTISQGRIVYEKEGEF